jgi:hypothetical protein
MPDRDVAFIRDLIYYQYANITAKSAFAASDGEQGLHAFYSLKHRGDRKSCDFIPPLLEKKHLKTIYDCYTCSGTLGTGDPRRPDLFMGGEIMEKNVESVPYVLCPRRSE